MAVESPKGFNVNSPEQSSGRMIVKGFNPKGVECALPTVDIFHQIQFRFQSITVCIHHRNFLSCDVVFDF